MAIVLARSLKVFYFQLMTGYRILCMFAVHFPKNIKRMCFFMASVQTMTIPQFLQRDYHIDTHIDKLVAHMKRHKIAYRIIGTTVFIMLTTADVAFAASTGIDIGGRRIYSKLINLSKWIIIVKGGFDIVNATVRGDFDVAKKSFFQYLMVYIILLGLPWALDQVDTVFKDI